MKQLVISTEKQNAASWHYTRAMHYYEKHQALLNERGLLHPNDILQSRYYLSNFRYHTQAGDYLMHIGPKVQRRAIPQEVDTSRFADDFELALIQRGQAAFAASIAANLQGETVH